MNFVYFESLDIFKSFSLIVRGERLSNVNAVSVVEIKKVVVTGLTIRRKHGANWHHYQEIQYQISLHPNTQLLNGLLKKIIGTTQ